MSERDPFARFDRGLGRWLSTVDAVGRIEIVKRSTDRFWLQRVIDSTNMQSTVVKAARARMRKLERGTA